MLGLLCRTSFSERRKFRQQSMELCISTDCFDISTLSTLYSSSGLKLCKRIDQASLTNVHQQSKVTEKIYANNWLHYFCNDKRLMESSTQA
ncbi:hypothetical protein AVEN_51991-1 [Araneus ventricosus]|uniref:Uncharacterized protein n=1 Tax=Araneus ventricosus TaxID=182803 RepID=A0A4Y2CFS7_ARAVE|nr:hypothetical protein AVEN_51991-1 [Araneus ventricosus]